MAELILDGIRVGRDTPAYVIAEIGHNHQGSIEIAKQLIAKAKECGAQAVKLQKRDNRSLFTQEMFDQPYDNPNSYGASYGEHREALELGRSEYLELREFSKDLGIAMFATPFDARSVDVLAELEIPFYKISSADLNNTPLLERVAQQGKPVLISTGGGGLGDVRRAHDTIMKINQQLCIMQCTASYPVEPEDMHLRVLETYQREFPEAVIGLSDHFSGICMGGPAFTLGARVFEKHFTLNRASRGTDHAFSLAPKGLTNFVRDLERVRVALGSSEKRPLPCEQKPLSKMGKKLVAARGLPAGHVLTMDDVAIKSPADEGLPPYYLDEIVGKVIKRGLQEDEALTLEDLGSK